MKRIIIVLLITMFLILTACTNTEEKPISENTEISEPEVQQDEYKKTDCEIIEKASASDFNQKKVLDWGDYEIIVFPPAFTGIKIDEIYSYKSRYIFNDDGFVSVKSAENDYYTVDRNGEIVEYAASLPVEDNSLSYFRNAEMKDGSDGQKVGEKVKKKTTQNDDTFSQKLYSLDDKPLSEDFDFIGYFYNGLALVIKDNKIGIIDEQGKILLSPSIPYDKLVYPPEIREFEVFFMHNDAFVIPIGGELAVVRIERNKKLFKQNDDTAKYEYTYSAFDINDPRDKAYSTFLKEEDIREYALKDLDGDGKTELITKKYPDVSFYTYNGKVSKVGDITLTGTTKLLCAKEYDGLIYFEVGGGADRYKYITLKNGKIDISDIWYDYYSYDGITVKERYKQFSDDENLIRQSANAHENNQDLIFTTL